MGANRAGERAQQNCTRFQFCFVLKVYAESEGEVSGKRRETVIHLWKETFSIPMKSRGQTVHP